MTKTRNKTKPTLVLLAAGMGSRYGGLKQLDSIGPNGETILDYSVYDAIQSGFGKVVFVIRDFMEEAFEEKIAAKFKPHIDVAYAYQSVNLSDDEPKREKPWGTGHAMLVARFATTEPFAVANADDFYGRDSFQVMSSFLQQRVTNNHFAMVGFELGKTLSPSGTVSRGVCMVEDNNLLQNVIERHGISKNGEGIFYIENEKEFRLPETMPVSMNLWGFHQNFFTTLDQHFNTFVQKNKENLTAEYYIPLIVNDLLNQKRITLEVMPTASQWFGVTYKEDKADVQGKINKLIEEKRYPSPLF